MLIPSSARPFSSEEGRLLCPFTAVALLAASLLSPTAGADTAEPGYTLEDLPYPGQSVTATLSSGDVVTFDGLSLDRYDSAGVHLANLATLPAFVFPSFLVVDPQETCVVFGESTSGVIYEAPLVPSNANAVTTLPFNFDAVYEDVNHVVVSAATCGIGCGNEIYRVNLSTGETVLLASVAGASGPVAMDAAGNLYYGTVSGAFPAPPAASDVIVWDAGSLTGSPVLTEADATVIGTGFESAFDLALDLSRDELYLAENDFATGLNRIRVVLGGPSLSPVLVTGTPFQTISTLEFVKGQGHPILAPYQPDTGTLLRYNTTDFFSVFERKAIHALRPTASLSGPGTSGPGTFDLSVEDGPPGGIGIVYYGPVGLYQPLARAIRLCVPVFVGLDLATLMRVPGTIPLDGSGSATRSFFNPGGLTGTLAIQVLFIDTTSGKIVGTSSAAFL